MCNRVHSQMTLFCLTTPTFDRPAFLSKVDLLMMVPALSRALRLLLIALALACPLLAGAQQMIWTDTYNGGLVTGSFSIGPVPSGIGVIYMDLPPGATVRSAKLYAVAIGSNPEDSVSFPFGTLPVTFNASTAGPVFQSLYGSVVLHTLDLTSVLDPALPYHLVDLTQVGYTNFREFMLFTEYELPGMGPITVDVFHLGQDSQLEENYTLHTSHPMDTGQPIAFGTMGAYAHDLWFDYEAVLLNGMELGRFGGADFNAGAGNQYGACATFHYANGTFEGRGDDSTDIAILGPDVLSELSTLVPYGTQNLNISYRHVPAVSPWAEDNIVNLAVFAYSSVPCFETLDYLGPDTVLCPGDTLVLNAYREGAGYLWQDGSTQATFTVTVPGTYIVQWAHPDCTWAPDTVVVGMVQQPATGLGGTMELCKDESLLLGLAPVPGAAYTWSDGSTAMPRTVDSTGVFTLFTTVGQCVFTDSVEVMWAHCEHRVEFPNVFTPNGDASNATFRPIAFIGVQQSWFSVYNRWGQLVYRINGAEPDWNGLSQAGLPVPDGVYFWILEYTLVQVPDAMMKLHGSVHLLR